MANSDENETTNQKPQGYAFLFIEARKAADDVSEIHDEEGGIVRIQRDPSYSGAKRLMFDSPAAPARNQTQWILPATSIRPEFYPAGLPHLPDIASTVLEREGRTIATWRDEACPRLEPEEAERIESSMPEDFREFTATMKAFALQGKGDSPEAAATAKAFNHRMSMDDVKEWVASMSRPGELDARFSDGFEALLRESLAEGWVPEEGHGDHPSMGRSAALQKDGRQRHLLLTAPMGIGSLSLMEGVLPPTPAPPVP